MYCIGIDVSKKALSVFDGKISLEFENREGLKTFYRYLKKHQKYFDNLVLIFAATGMNLPRLTGHLDKSYNKMNRRFK